MCLFLTYSMLLRRKWELGPRGEKRTSEVLSRTISRDRSGAITIIPLIKVVLPPSAIKLQMILMNLDHRSLPWMIPSLFEESLWPRWRPWHGRANSPVTATRCPLGHRDSIVSVYLAERKSIMKSKWNREWKQKMGGAFETSVWRNSRKWKCSQVILSLPFVWRLRSESENPIQFSTFSLSVWFLKSLLFSLQPSFATTSGGWPYFIPLSRWHIFIVLELCSRTAVGITTFQMRRRENFLKINDRNQVDHSTKWELSSLFLPFLLLLSDEKRWETPNHGVCD